MAATTASTVASDAGMRRMPADRTARLSAGALCAHVVPRGGTWRAENGPTRRFGTGVTPAAATHRSTVRALRPILEVRCAQVAPAGLHRGAARRGRRAV